MADPRGPVAAAMTRGLVHMVRRRLRGVWARGPVPAGPHVWAANHHSWWDPFVVAALLDRHRQVPCLVMEQENLDRYGLVRRLGVFGTGEQRRGLDHLRAGRVLVIYPEGELLPNGPVGPLARGAAWYAHRCRTGLTAVATRVVMRGQALPEAYLAFRPVTTGDSPVETTRRLAVVLAEELAELDALLATGDPRQPLPGFRREVAGRPSTDERIDRLRGVRPWR